MAEKVEVVGPLKGNWYAIKEGGVISQARFVDQSAAWVAWREYSLRGAVGESMKKSHKVKR